METCLSLPFCFPCKPVPGTISPASCKFAACTASLPSDFIPLLPPCEIQRTLQLTGGAPASVYQLNSPLYLAGGQERGRGQWLLLGVGQHWRGASEIREPCRLGSDSPIQQLHDAS